MAAAAAGGLDAFFTLMQNEGGIIVQETPRFDLESYIQNYKGATRFDRLLLIGQSSPLLCVDALKAAIAEAKEKSNVRTYREAWNYLRIAAPDDPEAQFDKDWVHTVEASNKSQTKRLERELKSYKNNLIKDSIRMGHEELGMHLQAIGDYMGATEAFNRMRADVSTQKHIAEVSKHLIDVAIERRDWATAAGHLNKVTHIPGAEEERQLQPQSYIHALTGLCFLGQKKYFQAATQFLDIQGGMNIPKITSGLLTSNDIAVYGGLTALASMSREDLQARVLENPNFRSYLEMEPQVRRAITQFVNGRYAGCLSILTSYRPDYLLDIFLQKHVGLLYEQIRVKCISQYLIPFSCVTLASMDAAFAEPGLSIEQDLVNMIREGVINARIDSIHKLVITEKENPRAKMHKQGIDAFAAFNKDATERIRRMNILAAELEVKNSRSSLQSEPSWTNAVAVGETL